MSDLTDTLMRAGIPALAAQRIDELLADLASTETITGDKTFSGTSTFSGTANVSGTFKVGGVAVTSTAAELNLMDAAPATVTFAAAAGAANVCNVTITVKDAAGATLTGIRNLEIWLSDAATGAGLTGTEASGTVQVKASEGTDLTALTAKKHLIGQTKAAGTYVLEITDTAKTGFYVCVKNPMTGAPIISSQLVAGNYGA